MWNRPHSFWPYLNVLNLLGGMTWPVDISDQKSGPWRSYLLLVMAIVSLFWAYYSRNYSPQLLTTVSLWLPGLADWELSDYLGSECNLPFWSCFLAFDHSDGKVTDRDKPRKALHSIVWVQNSPNGCIFTVNPSGHCYLHNFALDQSKFPVKQSGFLLSIFVYIKFDYQNDWNTVHSGPAFPNLANYGTNHCHTFICLKINFILFIFVCMYVPILFPARQNVGASVVTLMKRAEVNL